MEIETRGRRTNSGGLASRRTGMGRQARLAARAAAPEINPAPPGPLGGQYLPLRTGEVDTIIDTAFRILAEIGMGTCPPQLVEAATARGARYVEGRLFYGRSFVEDIIDGEAHHTWSCWKQPGLLGDPRFPLGLIRSVAQACP